MTKGVAWDLTIRVDYIDGSFEYTEERWLDMTFETALAAVKAKVARLMRKRKRRVRSVDIRGWGQVAGEKMYLQNVESRD